VTERAFDIDEALARVREAVRPFPRAMLFQLFDEGHTSAFEILVACLISVRTRDETSLAMARQLFEVARTPAALAELDINAIDALISKCAFHLVKSEQIKTLARLIVEENDGELPCSFELMTSYPGIGPKCANLALGIACHQPTIGVDIHVHRITNRWGYVQTTSPEGTRAALERVLPRAYWVEINALLVPFGKHVCTAVGPKCSTCPLAEMCERRGVTGSR
jgi:endonuclease-3